MSRLPPITNVLEIYLDDFVKILGESATPQQHSNSGHMHFKSIIELRKILVALVKYTRLVSSDHCHKLFDRKQNEFDASSLILRKSTVPVRPGDHNWNRVLKLTENVEYTENRATELGSLFSNDSSIKQGRALAFFLQNLYLARRKGFNNPSVEEMAKAFIQNHWKECFGNNTKNNPSKVRFIIHCEVFGLLLEEFGNPFGSKTECEPFNDNQNTRQLKAETATQDEGLKDGFLFRDIAAATTTKNKSLNELEKERVKFQKYEQKIKKFQQELQKFKEEKQLSAKKIEAHEKLIQNANSTIENCTTLINLEQKVIPSPSIPSTVAVKLETLLNSSNPNFADQECRVEEVNLQGRKRKTLESEIDDGLALACAEPTEKRAKKHSFASDIKLFSVSVQFKNEP